MFVANLVAAASCLMVIAQAMPEPGITRERHIIHTPIKFKIIHHYKIQKVPVIIKKHLYYIKQEEKKPEVYEEDHSNHIHDHDGHHLSFHPQKEHRAVSYHLHHQHEDDHEGDYHHQGEHHHVISYQQQHHHLQHHQGGDDDDDGDYEAHQQSQEEYDDYEYE